VVWKIGARQARRLVAKRIALLWDVRKSARDVIRQLYGCRAADGQLAAILEKARLYPVYGDGLYALLPADGALDKIKQAVELWKHAYDYYDEALHKLVAALLYKALADGDELYHEDPRAWYYFKLVENYPEIVDEVKHDRKGVLIRVGGTWLRKTVVYCSNRKCRGYVLLDVFRQF